MKGLFLWIVAIFLVVLVTHAQESDSDTDEVVVEGFFKDEDDEDRRLQAQEEGLLESMSENDDETMSEYADKEFQRLQDETESVDSASSSEEGFDESDEVDLDDGRSLHDGALTKWAHTPIASKIHHKSPEEFRSVKPKKVEKKKFKKHIRGVLHKKAAPRKFPRVHQTTHKTSTVTFAPLKKAPAIILPAKEGKPHKKVRVYKNKKFTESHSHSEEG